MDTTETIAAIATPLGEGGIGIVRLSGPAAPVIAQRLTHRTAGDWLSHTVHLVHLRDANGDPIDTALLTLFAAPNSYTGEDVVELSCHGGPAVVRAVLAAALAAGARAAEPGEFTRRAFLNGKMDLSQAEAVAALIQSRTQAAVRAANAQLTGALAAQITDMREALISLSARLEAEIDFPDDIEAIGPDELIQPLGEIGDRIDALLRTARRGIALRSGVRAAIVGKPNVGKSTLMNLLLGRDRVIVSEIPGATRDVVEEEIEIAGIPIRLADTAGIGMATGALDVAGMDRSRRQIATADVVIGIFDASGALDEADGEIAGLLQGKPCLIVLNKIDLPRILGRSDLEEALSDPSGPPMIIETALTEGVGIGIDEIERALADLIADGTPAESEGVVVTEARHEDALRRTGDHITSARQAEDEGRGRDIVSDELRAAADCLGEITGETATPAIIDAIFSTFCVGK